MTISGRLPMAFVILAHALAGWAYCGLLIGIGRQYFSMTTTLVIHAVGAPIGFVLISLFYFNKFSFTSPLKTALIFLAVVVCMDLFIVAPVFEKSYIMFASLLGTWLPFLLIFAATYLTGISSTHKQAKKSAKVLD
jgi:uncharacterized membrane protein